MKKIIRHILSGYIFERNSILKSLKRPNGFVPTKSVYPIGKVAVYTVNTGGYDGLREPLVIDPMFDYYAFTGADIPARSVWKKIDLGPEIQEMSSLEQARYVKTHPHLYFNDYDISIFIDGNIQIVKDIKPLIYTMIESHKVVAIHRHNIRDCAYHEARIIWAQGRAKLRDIWKQMYTYKKECFPKHYGLFETNVIIRKHNDALCKDIMESWWEEIDKFTKRDQLSFTYSLWKNGQDCDIVMSLGDCSRNNPYFSVVNHAS